MPAIVRTGQSDRSCGLAQPIYCSQSALSAQGPVYLRRLMGAYLRAVLVKKVGLDAVEAEEPLRNGPRTSSGFWRVQDGHRDLTNSWRVLRTSQGSRIVS
jgi:hypothetical protein